MVTGAGKHARTFHALKAGDNDIEGFFRHMRKNKRAHNIGIDDHPKGIVQDTQHQQLAHRMMKIGSGLPRHCVKRRNARRALVIAPGIDIERLCGNGQLQIVGAHKRHHIVQEPAAQPVAGAQHHNVRAARRTQGGMVANRQVVGIQVDVLNTDIAVMKTFANRRCPIARGAIRYNQLEVLKRLVEHALDRAHSSIGVVMQHHHDGDKRTF